MPKFLLALILLSVSSLAAQTPVAPFPGGEGSAFTEDGAWCWFSDPRAIYYPGANGPEIISGWVKQDGSIEAASLNPASGKIETATLWSQLEVDDHDNPAFVEAADGSVIAHYAKHGTGKFYQNRTNADGEVGSFSYARVMDVIDSAEFRKFPRGTVTYANPFRLTGENDRIYSFGRWTGYKPNIMWSDDNGQTWTRSRVLISETPFDAGNRPYVKYFSDGHSRIHITFTDGHPRVEPTNSVYYAYYEKGAFFRVDGSKICSLEELPFEPHEASVAYRATEEQGKAWVFDIAATPDGRPVIAYTRYPNDRDHRYHYAVYKEGRWIDHEICASGGWFPQTPDGETEREPNYSAGLTIHPSKTNTIYLSREIDGVFELEKRVTRDDGATWTITPITRKSPYDNIRPFVPRNYREGMPDAVLWMQNERYVHYTDFRSSIRFFIDDE